MKIFLCASLLFSVIHSYAQQADERLLYVENVEKYRRMKTAGMVLTIAGSIAMIVVTARVYDEVYYFESDEDDFALTLTAIAGASSLGAGIPLWIVGAHNHRKYSQKLKDISVGIKLNSQNRGLTLTYRF